MKKTKFIELVFVSGFLAACSQDMQPIAVQPAPAPQTKDSMEVDSTDSCYANQDVPQLDINLNTIWNINLNQIWNNYYIYPSPVYIKRRNRVDHPDFFAAYYGHFHSIRGGFGHSGFSVAA